MGLADAGDEKWAAGMFEGEGTVTLSSNRTKAYTRLRVSLTNTDAEIVEFYVGRWGGKVRRFEPGGRAKTAFTWMLNSRQAARFLEIIQPHLRTTKTKEKVALALLSQSLRRRGARDPGYRAMQLGFKERMHELNRRGISGKMPKALPMFAGDS